MNVFAGFTPGYVNPTGTVRSRETILTMKWDKY